jgi:hypothetical protein
MLAPALDPDKPKFFEYLRGVMRQRGPGEEVEHGTQ